MTGFDLAFGGARRLGCVERCQIEALSDSGEAVVWNVSVAGLYIVLSNGSIPDVGTVLPLSLWLPGDPRPIHARAQVVWRNPPSLFKGCGANAPAFPPGCGLKWVNISADDLAQIKLRVESVHPE